MYIRVALDAGGVERRVVAQAAFWCVLGAAFFGPHFCRRTAPLEGIAAPADARHLEVCMSGLSPLSEGRRGTV